MKVAISADHAGFKLKEIFKHFLKASGNEVVDFGTSSEKPVDYPDFGKLVGKAVSKAIANIGILICGSGIGMCMTANRFKNVRAAVIHDEFDAEMSRRHNNANVACFAARRTDKEIALKLLNIWLETPFEGGRHLKRIKKIELL